MITYRLLFLDESRHVIEVQVLHCRGDDEARETAKQYLDGRDLELWSGVKLIARLSRTDSH
jgi:hypothetical protein